MNRQSRDVYLDANATTPVFPKAAQAVLSTMEEFFGNPSSNHSAGLKARRILEQARNSALEVLGAEEGQIVFTSGATEAIQTAVFSALRALSKKESQGRPLCLYGATEHKAVPEAIHHWQKHLNLDLEIKVIPVDSSGLLDLEFLEKHAPQADLVCTMAVNNETGTIQDLAAIEKIVKKDNSKALWLVDAVQAVGKLTLDLKNTSIDYASVSGHKLYAPKGIGLLYARSGSPFSALMTGGGQENGARGGTENLPGVAAIATVFDTILKKQFQDNEAMTSFRTLLINALKEAFPEIVFNTDFACSVPTTINFAIPGLTSKEILDLFDAADIRVSAGSACSSSAKSSFVLDAMGLPKWRSEGAIRLSFGPLNTHFDIAKACARITEAGEALTKSCLLSKTRPSEESKPEILDGLVQLKQGSMCSWVLLDAASETALIIDPFEELCGKIENLISCLNYQVIAVLDTHLHVDHDSPRKQLIVALSDYLAPGADSEDPLGWPETSQELTVGNGEVVSALKIGQETLARVALPGHTVVGSAYLFGNPKNDTMEPSDVRFAFTGDTILIGGIGRTDFNSSSMASLYNSIRKLPSLLGPASVICPTHDYHNGFATTLLNEMRSNCFLSRILDPAVPMTLDEFAKEKPNLDEGIDDENNCELVCGNISKTTNYDPSCDINPSKRDEFLTEHPTALIIDVREPHEFELVHDWSPLGLQSPPINVPLTRFTEYLQQLLARHQNPSEQQIICLCRSGTRSQLAVEALRYCGFKNSWTFSGGLALSKPLEGSMDIDYVI